MWNIVTGSHTYERLRQISERIKSDLIQSNTRHNQKRSNLLCLVRPLTWLWFDSVSSDLNFLHIL